MGMLGFALCPIMRSGDVFLESVGWWESTSYSIMVPHCRL